MSWLAHLLEATDEAESPKSFLYWSGLTVISSIVKNNVYIQKGGLYRLYPTVYVLLVAKSGLRKSFPTSVAKKILREVDNTRLISGRISFQALLSVLSKAYTVEGEMKPRTDAGAAIISGEFGTAFVRDVDTFTIMTDLYDNHYNPTWTSTLKGTGTEELKDISITMLGAINQPHFQDLMGMKEISGGFVARCMLIIENKRHRKNPLLRSAPEIDYQALSKYPKKLKNVKGQFSLNEDAIDLFEVWYDEFEPEGIDDTTGMANRLHDHVLKISMLISLAESTELTITAKHMQEALDTCVLVGTNVSKITMGGGRSKLAPQQAAVLQFLLQAPNGKATRMQILRKLYGDVDAFELDQIVQTLTQAGGVTSATIANEVHYTMSPGWIKQYQEYKGD